MYCSGCLGFFRCVHPCPTFFSECVLNRWTDSFTYWTLIIGILRAGYTAFPISPRISAAGVAHLLQQTRARYMFVSDDMAMQSLAAAACDHPSIGGTVGASVDLLRTPSFERLFGQSSEASAPDFIPLPPMTPPAMGDPAIITYSCGSGNSFFPRWSPIFVTECTSQIPGSTVYPKPFTISHGALIQAGLLPCEFSNVSAGAAQFPYMRHVFCRFLTLNLFARRLWRGGHVR